MKTKFNFSIEGAQLELATNRTVQTPAMTIAGEVEMSIEELKELYKMQKEFIKELPDLLKEFALKMQEIETLLQANKESHKEEEAVHE